MTEQQLLVDGTPHDGDYGTPYQPCCEKMGASISGVDDSNWFSIASDWHGDFTTPVGVEFFDSEGGDLRINFCPFCGARVVVSCPPNEEEEG